MTSINLGPQITKSMLGETGRALFPRKSKQTALGSFYFEILK